MLKVLKNLFYIISLLLIGSCVYIASLPSKDTHNYSIAFDNVPKKMLEKQITFFENWKNWAYTDSINIKITESSDPLQSALLNKPKDDILFKIENEQVLDTLLIQKVYTTGEKTIQSLKWSLGSDKIISNLNLQLNEELSMKDKLYGLLKWKNPKREWLQDLHNRLPLLQQQLNKKASDYGIDFNGKKTFGPFHYIFLSGSGHVDQLINKTQKHIVALEQYLAEHNVKIASTPFTIYNDYNESNGNVIFSTAIPISTEIYIPSDLAIRYGYIDTIDVLTMEVVGNPKSTQALWNNFKLTKEATLTEMDNKRFLVNSKNRINTDDYTQWKQTLYWKIAPPKTDTLSIVNDSLIYIPKISE